MTTFSSDGHRIRRARVDDAPDIAALFQLVYEASSHPCKVSEFVSDTLLADDRNLWLVSERGGELTGCMGMLLHPWNRSWEFVRGLTRPDCRGGGLATALAQHTTAVAWESDSCDLVIAFPRSRTMSRIITDAITPGFTVVGHDGGINIAAGQREYHLVALCVGHGRQSVDRVVPDNNQVAAQDFVQREVIEPLRVPGRAGQYPPVLIAGDHVRHPDYGPFTFEYHPFCPSDSIEITAYTGPKSDPCAIANDLVLTLESFEFVRHVRLAALADKTAFIEALCADGFQRSAYLPAWYLENGARYDCVLLTRRTTAEEPADHGTRNLVDHFSRGYHGRRLETHRS